MDWIIGLVRIGYVQILRSLAAMVAAPSLRRSIERESIRQLCLASQAGAIFDDAALEELHTLRPQYIDLPAELNRIARSPWPEHTGADRLAELLRSERH